MQYSLSVYLDTRDPHPTRHYPSFRYGPHVFQVRPAQHESGVIIFLDPDNLARRILPPEGFVLLDRAKQRQRIFAISFQEDYALEYHGTGVIKFLGRPHAVEIQPRAKTARDLVPYDPNPQSLKRSKNMISNK
jgi:hypothetical protein